MAVTSMEFPSNIWEEEVIQASKFNGWSSDGGVFDFGTLLSPDLSQDGDFNPGMNSISEYFVPSTDDFMTSSESSEDCSPTPIVPFSPEEDLFAMIQSQNVSFAPAHIKAEPNPFQYGFSSSMFSAINLQQPVLPPHPTPTPTPMIELDQPQPNRGKKKKLNSNVPSSPHSSGESDDTPPHHEDDDGEDEEQFKRRHNASERKRQASINDAITQIKEMVFSHTTVEKKMSKGAVLKKTVDFLVHQNAQSARMRKENAALRAENQNLTKHVHFLRALLTANGLPAPSFSPASASAPLENDDFSQQPASPASKGRQTATLLAVFVFSMTVYGLSGLHLEIDGEYFSTRALQALHLSESTPNEYIALVSLHALAHVIGGWLLWIFMMFIRFIAMFTFASFVKQMYEPVIRDDDPISSLFHNHIAYAESYYGQGNMDKCEFHINEATNLLGVSLYDKNRAVVIFRLAFEVLRTVSHRMQIGIWADQLVVQLRGIKQYNNDLAKLMFLQSQFYTVNRPRLVNRSLSIVHQLLLTLNNAEVEGPSGNTLFALACMGMAWYLRFAPSNISEHSKYPFSYFFQRVSSAFRQLAWHKLSNAESDTRVSLGRFYMHVGLDFLSQGRLKDAVFSLTQSMDIHQHSKSPGFWRVNGFALTCVFFYQESYEQALHMLRLLDESARRSSDRRFLYSVLPFQTLIMLKVSTNKSDAHRALAAITEKYNDPNKPKLNKTESLLAYALAACRYRCGDIAGAWEIVKTGSVLKDAWMAFFEIITLDGYCELVISLLDGKINNISVSSQLPSRQEIEEHVTSALAYMTSFSNLYPIAKPALHMKHAMYLNIIGQQQKARVQLQQAQKLAREMKLQPQLRNASRMLEQLENDMNLQKNYSAVLNIQV